jgi:hypothetical protein
MDGSSCGAAFAFNGMERVKSRRLLCRLDQRGTGSRGQIALSDDFEQTMPHMAVFAQVGIRRVFDFDPTVDRIALRELGVKL